jgi:DNA (cytosine-5)-methyltransferase 1
MSFTIASLFSGCGGMDLGFTGGFNHLGRNYLKHSTQIVWANEINPEACKTYRRNLSPYIIEADIWEVIHSLPDRVDIVIGGFPCQDISINNKNASGIDGKRSGLYRALVEAVERTSPKIFVAENVKALLNSNHKKSLERVLSDFTELGYNVTYHLYNAADFGVPQTRERVFIVGTKDGNFLHPKPVLSRNKWVTAHNAIDDIADKPKDADWSHIWSSAQRGGSQGNRALLADRPGYTMRAECHGNTHYHYRLPRRISMREGARIQSFPDDFIFESKMRETERQIGNAVPPVLAWHVAKQVIAFLNGKQELVSGSQLEIAMDFLKSS